MIYLIFYKTVFYKFDSITIVFVSKLTFNVVLTLLINILTNDYG